MCSLCFRYSIDPALASPQRDSPFSTRECGGAARSIISPVDSEIGYAGEDHDDIPRDVIRVNVQPSVKAIREKTFRVCIQLMIENLGEGLEEIAEDAFWECISLHEILIPPADKAIKDWVFLCCCS